MPKARKPKRYYPVAKGEDGSVIYSSWADAKPKTNGTSGAQCKGCDTLKDITTFFAQHKVDLGAVTWAQDLDALDLTAADEEPAQPPVQNLPTSIRASEAGGRGRNVRLNLLPRKSDLRPSSFFHKVAAHTPDAGASAVPPPSSPPAPSAPSIPPAPPAPMPAPIQPSSSHSLNVADPAAQGAQPLVTAEDIHDVQDGVRLVREGLSKIEAFASKMSSVASSEPAPPAVSPAQGLPQASPPDQATAPLAVSSAVGGLASPRPSSSARDATSPPVAPVQESSAAQPPLALQEAAALQKPATPLTPAQSQRLAAACVVLKGTLRDIGVGVEGTLLAFGDIEGQGSLFYREPLFFPG